METGRDPPKQTGIKSSFKLSPSSHRRAQRPPSPPLAKRDRPPSPPGRRDSPPPRWSANPENEGLLREIGVAESQIRYSAPTIPEDKQNESMREAIMNHNLYAVKRFLEKQAVKLILKRNKSRKAAINNDERFKNGLTPLMLASCKRNYDIISLLIANEHELLELEMVQVKVKEEATFVPWESFILKQVYFKARSTPEYITIVCQKENLDPFKYCMELIEQIRKDTYHDMDQKEFYKSLICDIENYMCDLLDQVRSSSELRQLFHWIRLDKITKKFRITVSPRVYSQLFSQQFTLLEEACEKNLVKFVTHRNPQLILSKLLDQDAPILQDKHPITASFISKCFGLLFFIWPLLLLALPSSNKSENDTEDEEAKASAETEKKSFTNRCFYFVSSPRVTYECHLMSEIIFIFLLIANIVFRNAEIDYLGSTPSVLEWFIVVWIVGKVVSEFQEAYKRGPKAYFTDWWNYFDIIQLSLFVAVIIARVIDFADHSHETERIYKQEWQSSEPRLVSVGLLSVAYVFALMRTLSFSRTSRFLGPLRASMAKMLWNVLQFLALFTLVMFAFGLSLSELHGTYESEKYPATVSSNKTKDSQCQSNAFQSLGTSLNSLFWVIFGLLDSDCVHENSQQYIIDNIGVLHLAVYHIIVIFVLLSMLIAMMTQSFESTVENKDVEWKFHRTQFWIQFIRRNCTDPPPMNLLPNFVNLYVQIKSFLLRKCGDCLNMEDEYKPISDTVKRCNEEFKLKRLNVSQKLIERYKTEHIETEENTKKRVPETYEIMGNIL